MENSFEIVMKSSDIIFQSPEHTKLKTEKDTNLRTYLSYPAKVPEAKDRKPLQLQMCA